MTARLALTVAVGLLFATAASAQGLTAASFAGQWKSSSNANGTVIETVLTVTGETYISTQDMVTEGIFGPVRYAATQEGNVVFNPPDNLRLVVMKWSPTETNGVTNPMPPNSNWTILQFDGANMVVLDTICAKTATPRACVATYRKVQ
jgi:hypothetical protein